MWVVKIRIWKTQTLLWNHLTLLIHLYSFSKTKQMRSSSTKCRLTRNSYSRPLRQLSMRSKRTLDNKVAENMILMYPHFPRTILLPSHSGLKTKCLMSAVKSPLVRDWGGSQLSFSVKWLHQWEELCIWWSHKAMDNHKEIKIETIL